MANTKLQLKRSSVSGVIPTTGDISTGELGINVTDRKIFSSNGSVVFEVGSNLVNLSVTANLTVNSIIANGATGTNGQVLTSNGSGVYWSTVTGGGGGGFSNGDSISVNNFAITGAFTANSSNGSSGQVLTSNGSGVYWSTVTGGGGTSIETIILSNTSISAVKDTRYIIANTLTTTITLPSAPSLGDTIYIVVVNDLSNNIINRNDSNIMGSSENLTIDVNDAAFGLVFSNNTLGWRII